MLPCPATRHQIYREKVKAAAEGRAFTPPPPSAVSVSVGSSSGHHRSSSNPAAAVSNGNGRARDDWGDWGGAGAGAGGGSGPAAAGGGGGGAGGARNGFSSNSEYSRSQYMASAAGKEEFFARKMQENDSRPDHLPPNQGGKYVGFGSTPAPRPGGGPGGRGPGGPAPGVDDVTQLLSKGLSSLGQVAGMAASTASVAVSSGTQGLNQLLQEKQVAATLQQTQKALNEKAQARVWARSQPRMRLSSFMQHMRSSRGASVLSGPSREPSCDARWLYLCCLTTRRAQVGWTGLKSLYANVASTVESVAKDSGYNISLGSKAVASSLEQQRFEQQLRAGAYPGLSSQGHGSSGHDSHHSHHQGVHKSYSEGQGLGSHTSSSHQQQQQQYQQQQQAGFGSKAAPGGGNSRQQGDFGGFDDGADNGEGRRGRLGRLRGSGGKRTAASRVCIARAC